MNECLIYMISNTINNKVYIGQTWRTLKERFREHKKPTSKGCLHLYNAFNKYGRSNFTIECVAICSNQQAADYLEDLYIKENDSISNGYNLRNGGSCGKFTDEHKNKISEANMGHITSKETKIKIGNANRNPSVDTIQKMSLARLGKPNKAALNNKNMLGKKHSPESILKMKNVNHNWKDGRVAYNEKELPIEQIKNDTRKIKVILTEYNISKTTYYRIINGEKK